MRFGIREAIFLLVLLAVPSIALLFLFKPLNADIHQALEEVETKQATLRELSERTSAIEDLGLEIERGRELIALMEAKLPYEQEVDVILEQVWQVAKNNDLQQRSLETEAPVPAAMYYELPIDLVMEGSWDGFYQFLLELENLPRITRIHNLKIERLSSKDLASDNSLPPGSMRAEFTLSIYFESSYEPSD